ncbi:MAG: YkgJ family cysteine cluster protein [Pseudomonadota bacterium]
MTIKYDWKNEGVSIDFLKEEALTAVRETGASIDPEDLLQRVLPDLEALAPREDGQEKVSGEEISTWVRQRLTAAAYATRPHCIRCGTCCRKASPVLAGEDMDLFVKGVLKPSQVITIRIGEYAHSGITDETALAEEEMIKIREEPGTTTCIFYRSNEKGCAIHETRPRQCRTQECWNPDCAEALAGLSKLDRKALLEPTGVFWEIVQRHEERCSHEEMKRVMARLGATKGRTVEDVLDLLRYDEHIREFASDRFKLESEGMDFFFGRPLKNILFVYGLAAEQQPDGTIILKPADG